MNIVSFFHHFHERGEEARGAGDAGWVQDHICFKVLAKTLEQTHVSSTFQNILYLKDSLNIENLTLRES